MVALCALLTGAHAVLAIACLVCAVVCSAVCVARRRGGTLALIAAAAMAAASLCLTAAVAEPVRRPPALLEAAENGNLLDAIVQLDSALVPSSGGKLRATATLRELDDVNVHVPVVLFVPPDEPHPRLGATVESRVHVLLGEQGDAASALLFSDDALTERAPPPWFLDWAGQMREQFVDICASLPGDGGQLLPGLAVGDTSAVSPELDAAMKQSSLSHLTAVSGANCAIVVGAAMLALGRCGLGRRGRTVGALVLLAAFVILVTPQASVVRAAVMASLALIVHMRGRPAGGVSVLSLTVIGLLIADPWLALDAGFALSVLATAGLLVLARPLAAALARVLPPAVAGLVALPLAAQLACQPVLILLSSTLPLYGVAANILAAPAAPVGTVVGLIACLVGAVFPAGGMALAWVGYIPAVWIAGVARVTAGLPAASLPWLPGIGGALVVGLAALVAAALVMSTRLRRHRAGALLTASLLLGIGVYGGTLGGAALASSLRRPADWTVAACDIGQGDAVLVRGGGAVMLVDTGPDPRLLAACLDTLSIATIDMLVLTHYDLDHAGGVDAVLGRTREAYVQQPHDDVGEGTVDALAASGARVTTPVAGMSGALGGIRFNVLWPPDQGLEGNAGSIAVSLEVAGLRLLMLGDLGQEQQAALLSSHRESGRYDVIKVAHHGSADQEPRLYAAAAASVAIISVGAENDYGHPTADALQMLADAGSRVLRTDRQGMLLVWLAAEGIRTWTEKGARRRREVRRSR